MITSYAIWSAWVDLYNNFVLPVTNAGAPTDGTSGTGAGLTGPGTVLFDTSNKKAYINTNTKASPTWTRIADVASYAGSGAITSASSSAGVGYAAGAGGTVTQLTNKSTGVTLAKVVGQITMNNASLNDATTVTFTVTCTSVIAATDVVVVNHSSVGTLGGYLVWAHTIAANSFKISVRNVSGGALGEAIVLSYAIIKGASA